MPLSEEELRLLEQMERALVQEDPKFVSTIRGTTMRRTARRRILLAGLGFLAGVAMLMTGAITRITVLGIAGFVVMLGMAALALTTWRGRGISGESRAVGDTGLSVIDGGKATRGKGSSTGSFMTRLEERWRRRRDERGY